MWCFYAVLGTARTNWLPSLLSIYHAKVTILAQPWAKYGQESSSFTASNSLHTAKQQRGKGQKNRKQKKVFKAKGKDRNIGPALRESPNSEYFAALLSKGVEGQLKASVTNLKMDKNNTSYSDNYTQKKIRCNIRYCPRYCLKWLIMYCVMRLI